jgi:two-component system sensor histidine kinase/response regulator
MHTFQTPVRICLVDDDEDYYIILRDLLATIQPFPHTLIWYSVFEEAVAEIKRTRNDLYLIDFHIGVRSGIELLDIIRLNGCGTPAIMLTGQGEREIDMLAMERGAADFLKKNSLDSDLLEHVIRYALGRSGAERALRDSEARFRTLFANIPIGVFRMAPDGAVVNANKPLLAMTHFSHDPELFAAPQAGGSEPTGKAGDSPGTLAGALEENPAAGIAAFSIDHIIVNPAQRREFFHKIRHHGLCKNMEIEIPALSDTIIFGSVSATSVLDRNGKLVWIDGVVEDITERIKLDKAERERKATEAASQAKSEFLANISHEIRTPLNGIIGIGNLLWKTTLDARQKDLLRKIWSSSYSLLEIVNDILDFSKIESGHIELERIPFSLDDTLDNQTEMFGSRAQEKGIEIIISIADDVPRNLIGDPLRLGHILSNLINNAIKFTATGEIIIRILLKKAFANSAEISFSISDTGIGISPETQKKLFQPFTQADNSTSRKFGGTGLGLVICKRLIELMGGTIGVESESGKGSTFYFVANFGMGIQHSATTLHLPAPLIGLRVLVVDDNATSRNHLCALLQSLKMDPDKAASGEDALNKLNADRANPIKYGLVLIDKMMPGMNGLETLGAIRRESEFSGLPIIIMDGAGREEILYQAADSTADAFLMKPVHPSLLLNTCLAVTNKANRDRQSKAQALYLEQSRAAKLKGARLLVVEDNEINRQIIIEILENVGANVDSAINGKSAIEAVEKTSYDAVLMDIQMPEMDGCTATEIIRSSPRHRDLPIIALTAHVYAGEKKRCTNSGMNDHIPKPIEPEIVYNVLARWLRRTGLPAGPEPTPQMAVLPELPPGSLEVPGIAVSSGLRRVNNNSRLYTKILLLFQQHHAASADEIEAAIGAEDIAKAREIAHTVKGIAGNIGAEGLFGAAKMLEQALAAAETNRFTGLVAGFREQLAVVLTSITQFTAPSAPSQEQEAEQPVDRAKVTTLLTTLATLLTSDLSSAFKVLQELSQSLTRTTLAQECRTLETLLHNIEIDTAQQRIRAMIAALNQKT